MITLKDFINEECPGVAAKKRMLDDIEKLKEKKTTRHTFSFNIYDLEIDFTRNEVKITENLFDDNNEFLKINLDNFCAGLLN
jgi:hypothetical protein